MFKYKLIIVICFLFLISGCWENEIGRSYYPSGNIKTEATIKKGILDGPSIMYYENGSKMSKASYKNGLLDGMSISYYKNGKTKASAYYKKGLLHGKSSSWNKDGTLVKEVNFYLGRLVD